MRFRNPHRDCCFGCTVGDDSLEHYCDCRVLRALWRERADWLPLHTFDFFLCSERSKEFACVVACHLFACYSTHNFMRNRKQSVEGDVARLVSACYESNLIVPWQLTSHASNVHRVDSLCLVCSLAILLCGGRSVYVLQSQAEPFLSRQCALLKSAAVCFMLPQPFHALFNNSVDSIHFRSSNSCKMLIAILFGLLVNSLSTVLVAAASQRRRYAAKRSCK